ncbi:MAG TPA: urea ABC transporter ATP-binding subunit UrtE [Geminicoccus sp.]|jgi:urea transport system ATP-binding protein|uniref:urea ABC transporter ATP-binding subunit UrtE n=1 Tax=Geminicoccus sp. TaxID=2024832 RepID=UPI002E32815E|nr:urea ABC transporter ATP-binding subunit UrtE [Geminicoccus sp.]HEX2526492.1 urea ABC transporter ATP-binding subunit UrtE [Geminicoccus sp.]
MLAVDDLHLAYGASIALRGVSLSLRKGEVTCLLGRNGVGKTSLLRAIAGQLPIKAGTVSLDGQDLAKLPTHGRARAGVALVPQGREIFPRLTVEENLQTGFATRRAKAIDEELYRLFPVLKQMLHRKGGDLSGGQQQQLAIARALVTDPSVLLLDEPTEGIQPNIVDQIGEVVAGLARTGRMAILLVEQYLDFAFRHADRILVMDRGRIVLEGPAAEVDPDEVRRLVAV